jgi:hypothetical protein
LGLAAVLVALNPEWPALNLVMKQTKLDIPTIILDTAVNVMVTAMISLRILSVYWTTNKDVGHVHAKKYLNVVAMLVESAAPCAIFGILLCVNQLMDSGSNTSIFVLCGGAISQAWSMSLVSCFFYIHKAKCLKHMLQMLFPQLIIYRVAAGSAWTEKTSQELTQATASLAFAPRAINTATLSSEPDGLAERAHYSTDEGDFAHGQAISVYCE